MTSKILLTGGCVLTLGVKTPNFAQADVLIDDGRVAEIGSGLRARDAEQVDASDTIVLPGFVDTHRHSGASLSRNVGGDEQGRPRYPDRAEDVYAATLVGLLGAIEAGITTVADWSFLRSDDTLVEAALQAHSDAGLRTVFVHPARHPVRDAEATDAIHRRFALLAEAVGPTTRVALGSSVADSTAIRETGEDRTLARELGLRLHLHAETATSRPGSIAELARQGLLDPDVTLVHHTSLDDDDIEAIASSGAAVSLAPSSQMASGHGTPPLQSLIDRDIRPGLGVNEELITPGDLFAQMRATISMQHAMVFDRKLAGKAGVPRLMSTRDVIRHATTDGARAIGLGAVTGSLEPGKLADLIVLRTDRPNVFPINDPIGAVVWGMDTSNVDWVFVAGRPLLRNGVLEANVDRARTLATTAGRHLATAAGLAASSAPTGER